MLPGHGFTSPHMTVWVNYDFGSRTLRVMRDFEFHPLDWQLAEGWIELCKAEPGDRLKCHEEYMEGVDCFVVRIAPGSPLEALMDACIDRLDGGPRLPAQAC